MEHCTFSPGHQKVVKRSTKLTQGACVAMALLQNAAGVKSFLNAHSYLPAFPLLQGII